MKDNYIIFTDYPINRLRDAFGKEGSLDYIFSNPINPEDPFINIIPETLWIDQDGFESTVLVYSNTSWSIVEEDIKNLTIKTEENYGKTSMANSNSWVWKW